MHGNFDFFHLLDVVCFRLFQPFGAFEVVKGLQVCTEDPFSNPAITPELFPSFKIWLKRSLQSAQIMLCFLTSPSATLWPGRHMDYMWKCGMCQCLIKASGLLLTFLHKNEGGNVL